MNCYRYDVILLLQGEQILLKKPVKITNIRANRSKGGLRPQHLEGIQTACEMCARILTGAVWELTEITFHLNDIKSRKFETDTQTAGSIVLLMQVALPIALFGPSFTTLRLKGGTNAAMDPLIDYIKNVRAIEAQT